MAGKALTSKLDKNFITIYFMQGSKTDGKIAVRRLSLILGIVLLLFATVFFRVWQEMQVVKLGYENNQLRHDYNQALDRHRILLSKRNALASLERVEAIALNELGLVLPNSRQLVFLIDPIKQNKHSKFAWWTTIKSWLASAGP